MPDVLPVAKPIPRVRDHGCTVGSIHDDALPIYVHRNVLDAVLDDAECDVTRERGGFLVGGLHVDQREYIEVLHFLPAAQTQGNAGSLRFTHDTWAVLTRDIQQRFPDLLLVGWQHTHPNLGVFLSEYDLFIHRNFFREPWQIALVVDPIRQELRFFQWRQGQIVDCGFICV